MTPSDVAKAFRELEAKYLTALREIERCHKMLEQDQHPVEHDKQLRNAARLMSNSELNKEDLSADEIYDMLIKMSEDEVKKKIGFWAMPLPDTDAINTTKTYTTKPRR
jgi:hypothetical protein